MRDGVMRGVFIGASFAIISWICPALAFTESGTPPNASVGITTADIGESFTIKWSLDVDGGVPSVDLTATSLWTVIGLTSTRLTLDIGLQNTTVLGGANGLTQAAIVAFGFGTDNDTKGSFVAAGSVFDGISPGSGPQLNFPGGFTGIDVCIWSAVSCGNGLASDGLQAGATDSMTIVLAGEFGRNPEVVLSYFPIMFQTDLGAFGGGGHVPPNVPPVPIPAALPLLIGGLAVLRAFVRAKSTV